MKSRFTGGFVGYHGTSRDGAAALVEAQTFDPEMLQKRDHGFFGTGFYLAETKQGARFYSGIVLEVTLRPEAVVLDGGDGHMTPKSRPPYFDRFASWFYDRVMAFRGDPAAAERAVRDLTPPFSIERSADRLDYYKTVTSWVRETGAADAVRWGSEIVVVNPAAIAGIRRVSPVDRSTKSRY